MQGPDRYGVELVFTERARRSRAWELAPCSMRLRPRSCMIRCVLCALSCYLLAKNFTAKGAGKELWVRAAVFPLRAHTLPCSGPRFASLLPWQGGSVMSGGTAPHVCLLPLYQKRKKK